MKVRRLKSDCCGMKVGEVYEILGFPFDDNKLPAYVDCILSDKTTSGSHFTGSDCEGYFFEIVNENNAPSKSETVEPGTYFLNWLEAPKVIYLTNIQQYSILRWDDLLAEKNNWVKVSTSGYFEGNSIEDVRFISSPLAMGTKEFYKEKLGSVYLPRGFDISYSCSCGGKIDTHKPECPENQETMNEIQPFYILDESPQRYLGMPDRKKCCCGSESVGSPRHSEWCDKYEKLD